MKTISHLNYVPYKDIPIDEDDKDNINSPGVVIYVGLFQSFSEQLSSCIGKVKYTKRYHDMFPSNSLKHIAEGLSEMIDQPLNSVVVHDSPIFYQGIRVIVFPNPGGIVFRSKSSKKKKYVNYSSGTVIIVLPDFDRYWTISTSLYYSVTFFTTNIDKLPNIFLRTSSRIKFDQVIQDQFNEIRKYPIGQQCLTNYLPMNKMLGRGDYGNVFLVQKNNIEFAVKISRIDEKSVDHPYSRFDSCWFEVLLMKHIFNPLIEDKVCPNLPYLIDSFVCRECVLSLRKGKCTYPCVELITELANGTLRDFFKSKPPLYQLYSALFQIMAGLHAIQLNGQIMNYDVKPDNVLYYKIKPGGYWIYVIHGEKFYVPNTGQLFVLNDFGISRPMSPDYQYYRSPNDLYFRLGSRYAIVQDGEFVPIYADQQPNYQGKVCYPDKIVWNNNDNENKSTGGEFRLDRKTQKILDNKVILTSSQERFLKKNKINPSPLSIDFFSHPEVIPPFEFYNDTQDVIRSFVGGPRTTQKGDHKRYDCVKVTMYKKMKMYKGKGKNMKEGLFSTDPSQVLAGYFLVNFFNKKYKDEKEKIIETYCIS